MSLILEALRKSEAERRRGHVPGLHAELPPAAPRIAAAPAWPWPVVFAAAALLALAAWLAASAWRPPAAGTASAPSMIVATPTPALPRVAHLQPMAPAQRAPARMATDAAMQPREADEETSAHPARRTAATAGADGAPAPDAAAPQRAMTATVSAAAQPAVATALPPPARAPDSAPLQLADLAPQERKALPPLRLSMHLWNDDPARRFVILDGNRLGEGDRIGSLVVTAIVRDGVLLDWNGRAIKVPLR